MKQLIFISILALFFSCKKEETRVLSLKKGDISLVLETPTAGCEKCQKIMEDGLKKVSGVKASILNLNTKKVSIAYSPEETDATQLKNTVAELVEQFPCK